MKVTTLSTMAFGFAGLAVSQLETTLTSVNCINPAFCTMGTPTRTNIYTSPTITEYRRQAPPLSDCTSITSQGSNYATPISTHIQCGPDKSNPTCSTSYECGCNSSHFTWATDPGLHLCWPDHTATISYPDYGGGRSHPGRRVARKAKVTKPPKQTWTRTSRQPVAARATSQDFGGGRSQRRVAREAEKKTSSPPLTATTTSHFGCPSGVCGPGCRWGHECNKQFGRVTSGDFGGARSQRRVAREAEATAVAEAVHGTLLTLRA